jgi:hypothetical protein
LSSELYNYGGTNATVVADVLGIARIIPAAAIGFAYVFSCQG